MRKVEQKVEQTACKKWRERMGVEPTMDTAGHPSTDLKSAKLTGTSSLPQNYALLSSGLARCL